jgi:glycolate oxidase iron-sulfur subunit
MPTPAPLPTPRRFTAPDRAEADRCVRCGLCLPTCPTYRVTLRETSSPRGRIHLIQAVDEGRLDLLDPGFTAQMHQCLDCRACEAVCPSGVDYGHLIEAARAQITRAQSAQPATRIMAALVHAVFGDLRRFHRLASLVRAGQRVIGRQLPSRLVRALPQRVPSRITRLMGATHLLLALPETFFFPEGQRYAPAVGVATKPSVALLAGCVMGTVGTATDRATVRVLTAWGHPVIVPAGQECCGAIATHTGLPDMARDLARRNIRAFEASGADLVVSNAAGCGAALKDYEHLLRDDPAWAARAHRFSTRVRDATELLGAGLGDDQRRRLQPLPLHVTYQEPCHLAHAQRVSAAPRLLLRAIPGLTLVEIDDAALCCGSAGIYNLTHPTMAAELGARKVANICATGADLVVTANPGCQMQLRASIRDGSRIIPVLHLVDLLDASLRGMHVEQILETEG